MNAPAALSIPYRAKLRAQDFDLLAESGAFDHYARSELIEGEIWVVNALHRWHARMSLDLAFELQVALRRMSSPLVLYDAVSASLSNTSVPQPDLAIGDPGLDGPLPLADLKLAIEIADTSLAIDLDLKAALYAHHGVPEYWVVARQGARIHQHWRPTPDGYAERAEIGLGEPLTAMTIEGLRIETPRL